MPSSSAYSSPPSSPTSFTSFTSCACPSSPMSASSSLVLVDDNMPIETLVPSHPPLTFSYNERIRPLLDAVDRLRNLNVTKEGISLPTIVVVGDQSSGKSSVLESLAGISLPRGQGICTRVPLIFRLQSSSSPSFTLEFNGKSVSTDEMTVASAIDSATRELAGDSKGISNTPLTLIVKKPGVPDLTMVDLPGITRVPVHGQPENIYEQIRDIITEYISPEQSIILNVISASVDFSTSESIRMSQMVDRSGQRTLAVITKSDRSPDGLLEKVAADDVSIGLGYVCVRNRVGDESFDDARQIEAQLFDTHPLLSKIDKSIVGIPNLARKLIAIQGTIIAKCLPDIIRQINDKLSWNITELDQMPRRFNSVGDAMTAFMRVLSSAKDSLRKILITGEFDEFPDEANMHCTARLAEMLNKYSDELQRASSSDNDHSGLFLMEEVKVIEDAKGIWLPNFLPRSLFITFLHRKVIGINPTPAMFVDEIWDYLEGVVVRILFQHCENYPQLQAVMRRAAEHLVARMKKNGMERMQEMLEMEKVADFTCNPEYMSSWNELMSCQQELMLIVEDTKRPSVLKINGFREVDVGHLRGYKDVVQQAFDMKMRMIAYWKVVLRRVVDSVALHLLFSVRNLVDKELEKVVAHELMMKPGGGIERMLDEVPSVANKRGRLTRSIGLLKDSKEVLSKIMDFIV